MKAKKPKKATGSKTSTKKKRTGAKVAKAIPARTRSRAQKYSQSGAPWWKSYLS